MGEVSLCKISVHPYKTHLKTFPPAAILPWEQHHDEPRMPSRSQSQPLAVSHTRSGRLLSQPSLPPGHGVTSPRPSCSGSSPSFSWASALSNSQPHCCGQPESHVSRGTCQPPGSQPAGWLLPLLHDFFPLHEGSVGQLPPLTESTWSSGDLRGRDSPCSEAVSSGQGGWQEPLGGQKLCPALSSLLQMFSSCARGTA